MMTFYLTDFPCLTHSQVSTTGIQNIPFWSVLKCGIETIFEFDLQFYLSVFKFWE
jgi:hypothetical protein